MSDQSLNICVFRLSAMGDVILLVQAVRNLLDNNPNATVTVVTRPAFQVFFGKDDRLHFHDVALHDKHKGVLGLHKLYKELKEKDFDYFLDMHDVLRSQVVRSFFKLFRTKVFIIDKDRKTKEAIVSKKKALKQQKHSVERYLDVINKTGLKTVLPYRFVLNRNQGEKSTNIRRIGIAPFAAHDSKEWGVENFEALLAMLSKIRNTEVLLFGGGEREVTILEKWEKQFKQVKSVAGKYKLAEELDLMSTCDCFLAMDSGNMHMASLVGVPTISLWLSTHPFLGFAPWGNSEYCIQPTEKDAPCRPVSVYGKINTEVQQKCVSKSRALITAEIVMKKIKELL